MYIQPHQHIVYCLGAETRQYQWQTMPAYDFTSYIDAMAKTRHCLLPVCNSIRNMTGVKIHAKKQ